MKNSKSKVLLGAATLAAAVAHGVPAAQAATATIPMTAKVLAAIQITKTASMLFGSITESGAGGKVVLSNIDTRSATGGVSLIGGTGATSGGFTVKAATGVNYDLAFTAASATVTNGLGDTMNVTGFTLDGGAIANPYTNTAATATYKMGGTLNVGAGQATGNYTCNIAVTAVYQ
ncbi:MAG TPA: DUF4402 domain-containing protein [Micavibrio sp.]|nr:DUF4402 domain-containing protein [Micavibrio sp.]